MEVGITGRPEVEAALSVTQEIQPGDVWESTFSFSGEDHISNYILVVN